MLTSTTIPATSAKSRLRLRRGSPASLCPSANAPGPARGQLRHPWVLYRCRCPPPPSPERASPTFFFIKKNKEERERENGRREGVPQSPAKSTASPTTGYRGHAPPHAPPSPRSSAVQWGSCGQGRRPPPARSAMRHRHFALFSFFSHVFSAQFNEFLGTVYNLLSNFFIFFFLKTDPFWHRGEGR